MKRLQQVVAILVEKEKVCNRPHPSLSKTHKCHLLKGHGGRCACAVLLLWNDRMLKDKETKR